MPEDNAISTAGNHMRELVAEVAAAYFANSHVPPAEIPTVIQQIAASLGAVGEAVQQAPEEVAGPAKLSSAQIRKSVTPAALLSFEDNKPYKTLRRHLATRGLTPEQYREKWGLPRDYPMVSPNYSAARSEMAKSLGLGQKGRQARGKAAAAAAPAVKRGRGRPAKGS